MKSSSILVNVARGGIVNQDDLIEAVKVMYTDYQINKMERCKIPSYDKRLIWEICNVCFYFNFSPVKSLELD